MILQLIAVLCLLIVLHLNSKRVYIKFINGHTITVNGSLDKPVDSQTCFRLE